MTMPRDGVHTRMQSRQRADRKRSAGVVATPSPKRLRRNAGDAVTRSPRSSPMKRLFGDSDFESPTFVSKSFYGSRKRVESRATQQQLKSNILTPSSSSLPSTASLTESPESETKIVIKTSPRRLRPMSVKGRSSAKSKTLVPRSARVVLSPLKGQNFDSSFQGKKTQQAVVTRKRHRSLPAKVAYNTSSEDSATPVKEKKGVVFYEESTPTPNRKFFKYKSPASACKTVGGIIIGKGFNLKFVPRMVNKNVKSTKQKKIARRCLPQVNKTCSKVSPTTTSQPAARHSSQAKSPYPDSAAASTSLGSVPVSRSPQSPIDVQKNSSSCSAASYTVAPGSHSLFSSDTQSLASDVSGPVEDFPVPELHVQSVTNHQGLTLSALDYPVQSGDKQTATPGKKRHSERQAAQNNSATSSPRIKFIDKEDDKQLVLDAGQKKYGVTQCRMCGMVYAPANPSDESMHAKFHQHTVTALKFPGWKKERVVNEFLDDGSRVICVLPEDQNFMKKKVDEVNHVMTQELGFPDQVFTFRSTFKAFFYITEQKRIEGCCIAESIKEGYRVLPNNSTETPESQRPWFCAKDSEPASLGIGRLWVYGPARKRGIARRLVDCVRQWFEYGIVIDKSRVAFSDPTPDGRRFAVKYTETPTFLVYKYIP